MSVSSVELLKEFTKARYQPKVVLQQLELTPELIRSLTKPVKLQAAVLPVASHSDSSSKHHSSSTHNKVDPLNNNKANFLVHNKADPLKRKSSDHPAKVVKAHKIVIDVDAEDDADAFKQELDGGLGHATSDKKALKKAVSKQDPSQPKRIKTECKSEVPRVANSKLLHSGTGVVLTCITSSFKPSKVTPAATVTAKKPSHDNHHSKMPKKSHTKLPNVSHKNSHSEKHASIANVTPKPAPKPLLSFTIPKVQGTAEKEIILQDEGHIVRVSGLPRHADRGFVSSLFDGCHIVQVNFTYLPNGQPDGKAYIEFHSDFDQQRALDRNECSTGPFDFVVAKASRREMEWVLKRSKPSFQFLPSSEFVVNLRLLPSDCSSDDIISLLKDCNVVEVHYMVSSDGLFDGSAFVELGSAEDCLKAVAKNNACIGKNAVEVVKSTRQSLEFVLNSYHMVSVGHNYIVWLRGLPSDCLSSDVRTFLSGCLVADVHFTYSQFGSRSGECFVELHTDDDLRSALSRNNRYLGRNCIMVFRSSHGQMSQALRRNRKNDPSQLSTNTSSVKDSSNLLAKGPADPVLVPSARDSANLQPLFTNLQPSLAVKDSAVTTPILIDKVDYPGIEYLEGDVDDEFVLVDECPIESEDSPSVEFIKDKNTIPPKNEDLIKDLTKGIAARGKTTNSSGSSGNSTEKSGKKIPSLLDLVISPAPITKAKRFSVSSQSREVISPTSNIRTNAETSQVSSLASLSKTEVVPDSVKTSRLSSRTEICSVSAKVTEASSLTLLSKPEVAPVSAKVSQGKSLTLLTSGSPNSLNKTEVAHMLAKVNQAMSATLLSRTEVDPEFPKVSSVISSTSLLTPQAVPEAAARASNVEAIASLAAANTDTVPASAVPQSRFCEKFLDTSASIPFILDGEKLPETAELSPDAVTKPQLPINRQPSITCSEEEWQSLCYFTIERIDKNLPNTGFLRTLFEPFGQLVELLQDGKHGAVGKYSTPDAAQLAIVDMNGVQLGTSSIQVSLNKKKLPSFQLFHTLMKQAELCNRIYVSNINRDVLQCDLKSAFMTVGNVTSCQLSVDTLCPNKNAGYAYIEFETAQMASDAIICMNLINFRGQSLRVGKAVTPANVHRGALTPQWNRALSVATEIANVVGQRLIKKRKSRFDSHIPSKLAKKLSDFQKKIAAESEVTMATGDIDLRVPSSNSNTAIGAGDLAAKTAVTTLAGERPVDKVDEKQRIVSLITRVTEMLRTGKLGPITPHDVSVTKRNFSDTAGTSSYELDIDARDFRPGHVDQSQECVSVTHARSDNVGNMSAKNMSVAGELGRGTSVDRTSIHTETHLDYSHDHDGRQNLLDFDERSCSMDRGLSEFHRSNISLEPNVGDSLWSNGKKVIFKDCRTDQGVSTTLKNGHAEFGSLNNGYTSSSSNFRGESFVSKDIDLRNMSSPAARDVDLREKPPFVPNFVCRDLDIGLLRNRCGSSGGLTTSPEFVMSRMLNQFGSSASRRVSIRPNDALLPLPLPEIDNDEDDWWRPNSNECDADERKPGPQESAAESIDDFHDVDYRTLSAARRH